MLKSGNTFFVKDITNNNYLNLQIIANGQEYFVNKNLHIPVPFTFTVKKSVVNDNTYIHIGDTVTISSVSPDTHQTIFATYGFNFILPNNQVEYIICSTNTYCSTTNDPSCLQMQHGTDYGKVLCMTTPFYLYNPELPDQFSTHGYVYYDDTYNWYGTSTMYDQPQLPLSQLVLVSTTAAFCNDQQQCSLLANFIDTYTVSCDDNCNCTLNNGTKLFSDTSSCKCPKSSDKFSCDFNGCVPDDQGTYTTSDCDGHCTSDRYNCVKGVCVPDSNGGPWFDFTCANQCKLSLDKYSCSNGKCVKDDNGTYFNSNCNGMCGIEPLIVTKKSHKLLITAIAVIIIMIIVTLIMFYLILRKS